MLCIVLAAGWWRSVLPLAVSSGLLAITLWAGGGLLAQSLTLIGAWALVAVGRFALLRAWVFAAPPAEETGRSIVTRT